MHKSYTFKERCIKLVFVLLIILVAGVIEVRNPEFWPRFIHGVASGNVMETITYLKSFGGETIIISFLLGILTNAIGLLPSIFVSTANGVLFGLGPGILLSWLSETLGVIISFVLMRTIFKESAHTILNKHEHLSKLNIFNGRHGFSFMVMLRSIPYFPSIVLTALGAVSSLSLVKYALANFLGKLPSTSVEVIIGHDVVLGECNISHILIVILLLFIMVYISYKIQMYKKRRQIKK